MSRRYFEGGALEPCPICDILDRIGDRWSLLVLWSLTDGARRFTELRRDIGDISQRMLAQTVRRLEQDGFLSRTVTPSVPQRVDYALTPLGRSFLEPLGILVGWADAHHDDIRAARAAYVPPIRDERAAPVSAIAWDVGFADLSTFSHRFRRAIGLDPTAWRGVAKKDGAGEAAPPRVDGRETRRAEMAHDWTRPVAPSVIRVTQGRQGPPTPDRARQERPSRTRAPTVV